MTQTELYLLRRQKGIKLSQIAEYVGCSIPLLSRYENNKVAMGIDKVQKYKEFILNYEN